MTPEISVLRQKIIGGNNPKKHIYSIIDIGLTITITYDIRSNIPQFVEAQSPGLSLPSPVPKPFSDGKEMLIS